MPDDHASGPRSAAKAWPADEQSRERQIGQRVLVSGVSD
jgi:hypothetical protein